MIDELLLSTVGFGGPAYPSNYPQGDKRTICLGLTVRDYFAAKAMQSYLLADMQADTPPSKDEHIVLMAYAMADHMLKEREK